MNRWIAILLALVIIFGGVCGFFYWQQSQDLDEALAGISSLNGQFTTLQSDISSLNGNISDLSGSITTLEDSVAALECEVCELGESGSTIAGIITELTPSVVLIEVGAFFGGGSGSGSGVILTNDGYVMTNHHVIDGGISIQVILADGQSYTASVVDSDANLDLAILEINSTRTDFPKATLGNYDDITVGEGVLTMGFPYADFLIEEVSVSSGIVSAIRFVEGYEYIQTDAAINPGNSGGPLVNLRGEVIGINSWTYYDSYYGESGENLGFAIPVNDMRGFIEDTIGVID